MLQQRSITFTPDDVVLVVTWRLSRWNSFLTAACLSSVLVGSLWWPHDARGAGGDVSMEPSWRMPWRAWSARGQSAGPSRRRSPSETGGLGLDPVEG